MNAESLQERWQVEAGGVIYVASFHELPEWIVEGSLLPGDKVRRGNLRWIEAGKVPSLIPFFNAKASGLPMPVVVPVTNAETVETRLPVPGISIPQAHSQIDQSSGKVNPKNPDVCSIHNDRQTFYVCDSCSTAFCKVCPNSYGGSVKICPDCGALCSPLEKIREARSSDVHRSAALAEGFGINDFFKAFAFPFKFKASLVFGAVLFMFFSLGQSAGGIGGIYMFVAVIFCALLANMLTFGVLATTVDNFSQGRLASNFMPSFDDFSIWDDILHPFFLSIGIYVSSFGPFILVVIIGAYLVLNAFGAQKAVFQNELERVPGTQYYTPDRTMEQSAEVKKLIGNVSEQNEERLRLQDEIATGTQTTTTIEDETEEIERMAAAIQESRKAQLESMVGKTPETQSEEYRQMFAGILHLAAPLVVFGMITLLWGLFYLPAACAVAGYTRSLKETLNPLVGLDTIKRLGFIYVKILAMGFVLLVAYVFVLTVLNIIFSPLDLPRMGNLPAKAVGSLFGFYFSVVFSCVLGYALFKASDRLRLPR